MRLDRSIRYMLIASLLFSLMNVMVKDLGHIPVSQKVFMRSIVMLILVFAMLRRRKVVPWGKRRRLLILRGLFGSLGIAFFFYTLDHMPLVSAVVVHYLTPIFTALVAFVLVRERLHPLQWLFFAMCFGGIYVIKGFDPRVDGLSLLIGVLGTLAAATAYNIISLLKDTEHHLVIMFYFPLVTLPLVIAYMGYFGEWVNGSLRDWVMLTGIGVLTYGAQYFLTRSYQIGAVNKVSIISYLGVVYAMLFSYFYFDEWYALESLLGVALVVSGVVLNVWFKPANARRSLGRAAKP